jgi:hypothetical protein
MNIQNISQMPEEKNDKPSYGSTVVNGNIRFFSASAIQAFDPKIEGGCHARYWFEKVEKRKTIEQTWHKKGKKEHREIAHYLETGENTIGPIVRPGAHFLPRPGKDLVLEKSFGDYEKAVAARDAFLAGEPRGNDPSKYALTYHGIPVIGEMDCRHRRGEWVSNVGMIIKEDDQHRTAEIVDWKTSSDIVKYGKTPDGLYTETVQMPLYADATTFVWPDIEFVRISHGQFGTRRREAHKVSALLDRAAIAYRRKEIESTTLAMIHVVRETDINKVEKNTSSCSAFRGCDHASYCNRPAGTVAQLFQIKTPGDQKMPTLFDAPTPVNGTPIATGAGTLFDTGAKPAAAVAPPPPLLSEAERQALVEQEKARLMGTAAPAAISADPVARALAALDAGTLGYDAASGRVTESISGSGFTFRPPTQAELHALTIFAGRSASNVIGAVNGMAPIIAPAAPPPLPNIAAVNPPDSPPPSFVQSADPIPPEVAAQIQNPELRARVESHAVQHAAATAMMAAAENLAEEKASGRCPRGKQRIALSMDEIATKMHKCSCGKEIKLRPAKEADGTWAATLSSHNMPKTDLAAPTATVPPPFVAPTSVVAVPPPFTPSSSAVVPLPPPFVPPASSAVASTPITNVPVAPPPDLLQGIYDRLGTLIDIMRVK